MSKFVNIGHISILGQNLPESIILGYKLDVRFALSARFHKN